MKIEVDRDSNDDETASMESADSDQLILTVREFVEGDRPGKDEADPNLLLFSLTFYTEEYWGRGKTFHPEVVVKFHVHRKDERKHWHVPVLLGPWAYTTYRGS